MTVYVGIDQSYTCTGMVGIRDGAVILENTYKFKKENYKQIMDTCRQMVAHINDVRKTNESVVVCIEGYAYSSKFTNNLVHMGELGGLIKSCMVPSFHQITVIPPTTLKKFVTGRGNCAKDMVMRDAFKKWSYDNNNNNLVDAFCIAKFIEALDNGDKGLSKKVAVIDWESR